MSIIITGSIAFDHILQFPGLFEEHIIPNEISNLNISFLVDKMQKMRGGCASNIAYSLAMLGFKPSIMGSVGEDFDESKQWLEKRGVDTSLIKEFKGIYTASCFITTDKKHNQITGFYTGAMAKARTLSFKELDPSKIQVAIISPNDPEAMIKYAMECRELSIPFIFDPGQNIPRISAEELLIGMEGSVYTTLNTYELNMVLTRTGKSEAELLNLTGALIVTDGANGSIIKRCDSQDLHIKAATPRQLCDPTGAGDAYRAGLIAGYVSGQPIEISAQIASIAAVYVVEHPAPAQHHFTIDEFAARYFETYGVDYPLE